MKIPFLKMHGAANDFVVIDHREPFLTARPKRWSSGWCDRRRGIGADGVLLVEPDPELDFVDALLQRRRTPRRVLRERRALCRALRARAGPGPRRRGALPHRGGSDARPARRRATAPSSCFFGAIERPGEAFSIEASGRGFAGRRSWRACLTSWSRSSGWSGCRSRSGARRCGTTRASSRRRQRGFRGPARPGPGRDADLRAWRRGRDPGLRQRGDWQSAAWSAAEGDVPPIAVMTAGGDELTVRLEADRAGWQATSDRPGRRGVSW